MKKQLKWTAFTLAAVAGLAIHTPTSSANTVVENISGNVNWLEPQSIWVQPTGDYYAVDAASHLIYHGKGFAQPSIIGKNSGLDVYGLPLGGYLDIGTKDAMFNAPQDVVVGRDGTIYISDANNHSVRKVIDGVVYTHAGTGKAGFRDGSKTEAQFYAPSGLAIDTHDNLYVADTLNHRIRKITPDGQVTTIAGASDSGYIDGSTSAARFNEPADIAINEQGQLFVSDSGNQVIRLIAGSTVSTYAGVATNFDAEIGYFEGDYVTGKKEVARFNFPRGLHYAGGYLFIADSYNNQVRAVTPEGNVITLAGQLEAGDVKGAASTALFHTPNAVHYAANTLYVTDTGNRKVKSFALDLANVQGIVSADDLIASTPLLPAGAVPQIWFNQQQLIFSPTLAPFRSEDKLYVHVASFFKQADIPMRYRLLKQDLLITHNGMKQVPITDEHFIKKNRQLYMDAQHLQDILHYMTADSAEHNAFILQSN